MEARDVLKRPVITEKSSEAMAEDKYTFDVDTRANKTQVKIAVTNQRKNVWAVIKAIQIKEEKRL